MDLSKINFLAVLVAATSFFIIGGLWYSPLLSLINAGYFAVAFMVAGGIIGAWQ
jgi:hypothetical protein